MLQGILQNVTKTAADFIKESRLSSKEIAEVVAGHMQGLGDSKARVVEVEYKIDTPFGDEIATYFAVVDGCEKEWSAEEYFDDMLPQNAQMVADLLGVESTTRLETPEEAVARLDSEAFSMDVASYYAATQAERSAAYKRLCEVNSQIDLLHNWIEGDPYGRDDSPAAEW